jgi:hypothetical protein
MTLSAKPKPFNKLGGKKEIGQVQQELGSKYTGKTKKAIKNLYESNQKKNYGRTTTE